MSTRSLLVCAPISALFAFLALVPVAHAGLPAVANWSVEAEGSFDQYGYSVAGIGDVNGDGFSDFAVGSPQWDPPGLSTGDAGGVYVYFGSGTGLPPTFSPSWKGWQGLFGGLTGWSVAGAGDVNGDGYDDMIVGQPGQGLSSQRAFVYLGAANGFRRPTNTASRGDWECIGRGAPAGTLQFGWSVAGIGDMNGDGFSEVAVGAPNWSDATNQPNKGSVSLWRGRADFGDPALGNSDNGTLANLNFELLGSTPNQQVGWSVSGAGDVNADGLADMIVGIPGDNARTGRARLFLGSNGGSIAVAADDIAGFAGGSAFGMSVACAGDVNGDGFADVLVGGSGYNGGRGGVWLFVGRATAPHLQLWASWQGDAVGDSLGLSVQTAGDINGDGYADIVLGAGAYPGLNTPYTGKAKVFYGKPWGMSPTADWSAVGQSHGINQGAAFGHSVCAAGDVNGDGFGDLLIGSRKYGNSEWGRAYLYLGAGNTPNKNNAYTAFGYETSGQLGASVAVGDFNQDGWADVVTGAPAEDGTAVDQGRLHMYLGGPFGPQTSPNSSYTFPFAAASLDLGRSIAFAGDVDGDGFNDVAAGAPASAGGGFIIVYHGNASGQFWDGVRNLSLITGSPAQVGDRFGQSVASAGDVNGDGYADLLVGAPGYDGPAGTDAGRVYLYLGRPGGILGGQAPAAIFEGSQFGEQFGHAVSTAGDVNADGRSDVVFGAPYYDRPAGIFFIVDAGRFEIHLGTPAGIDPGVWHSGVGGGNDALGYAVAEAGDVNGDGRSDVLVGAPTTGALAGAVQLHVSLPTGGATVVSIGSTQAGGGPDGPRFGNALAPAGDQNGDGYSDFYVCAPGYDGTIGGVNEGRVMLYHGNASAAFGQPDWFKEGGQFAAGLGSAAAADDITGDGFPDLVVGASLYDLSGADFGYIQTFLGNDGGAFRASTARTLNSWLIQPLGITRFPAGFGWGALMRSPAGRTKIRMDYEVRAIQFGPALTSGNTGAFLDTGPGGLFYGSSVSVIQNVTNLTGEMPFAWQTRYRTREKFFPTTPWMSPGVNGRRIYDLRTSPNPAGAEDGPMPAALEFAVPQPNPARGPVRLAFALPTVAHVEVDVLDLQGRVVRTLASGQRAAGRHAITWDGADRNGHAAAPGVYFARVKAGANVATQRMVRVR